MKPLHELKSLVDLFYKAKSSEIESKLIHFKNNWAMIKNSKFKFQKFFNFEIDCALDIVQLKNVLKFYKERCSIVEVEEQGVKYLQFNFENGISFKLQKYETSDELFSSTSYQAGFNFPEGQQNLFKEFKDFKMKYFIFSKELLVSTDRSMIVACNSNLQLPYEVLTESDFYVFASTVKEKLTLFALEDNKAKLFFESCFLEFEIRVSEISHESILNVLNNKPETLVDFSEKAELVKQCLRESKVTFTGEQVCSDKVFVQFDGIDDNYRLNSKYVQSVFKKVNQVGFIKTTRLNGTLTLKLMTFENDILKGSVACLTD